MHNLFISFYYNVSLRFTLAILRKTIFLYSFVTVLLYHKFSHLVQFYFHTCNSYITFLPQCLSATRAIFKIPPLYFFIEINSH